MDNKYFDDYVKVKMLVSVPVCRKFYEELGSSLFIKDKEYLVPFNFAENWERKRWCLWI